MSAEETNRTSLERWRLVLGQQSHGLLGPGDCEETESALSWLYDRDESLKRRGILTREGGCGASTLTTVDWVEKIHQLFPKETIERLEQDAVEHFQVDDLITNLDVLRRVEPNQTLLKAVLRTKHLMNQDVLALARTLVRRVVEKILKALRSEFRRAFAGHLDRRSHTPLRRSSNFDFQRTLARNLKNFDGEKVVMERAFFHSRVKRQMDRWQVILLVDQSGSMLDSTIHAAITASCLWSLPGVKSHLCLFDTQVVDLTEHCSDPVETLMKTQLGGGTDIAKAVAYGQSLIRSPRKAVIVLITDFFEGGSSGRLVREVARLCAEGTTVLGLAALDQDAAPNYDRTMAQQLVKVGAEIAALTPGELAAWLAEKIR